MKNKYNILLAVLLMAFFMAGCGCGGNDTELVSLEITPVSSIIEQGAALQFIAIGTFSDNTTQDMTTLVTWSSTAENIAQISNATGSQGLATSVSAGTTTITAVSGSIRSNDATLTVVPRLDSITVSPAVQTITRGATQQFIATGHYSDGSTQDLTASANWESSAGDIASISNAAGTNGLASAVAVGITTITATSGIHQGTASLTVVLPLVSIKVTPERAFALFGRTVQFTAIGTYADGSTQDITQIVTWSSSDESIATISNDAGSKGLATTDHKLGTTIITATLGTISGSASLFDPETL